MEKSFDYAGRLYARKCWDENRKTVPSEPTMSYVDANKCSL